MSQVVADLIKDHGKTNDYYSRSSILIVDDDFDIARVIVRWLDRDGFKVSAFTDPAMALEYFKLNYNTCSLILSNIRMPGMNGYDFIKKTQEINKQAKVIFMSSFDIEDKEFHNVISDIKVDAFLQKPFTLRELRDTLQKNSVTIAMR